MRNYTAERYKELVTGMDDEVMQRFMNDEQEFIAGVKDAKNRTFIDLGAGYGRVMPLLSKISRNVIAIEINPNMYKGLEKTAKDFPNLEIIKGDLLNLAKLIPGKLENPVFLFLQNTLGTIERGNAHEALRTAVHKVEQGKGSIVLSLFRQPALGSWGIRMYGKILEMVGRKDPDKTVLDKGVFVTDLGYTSKWWTDEEIEGFKKLGKVVREETAPEYALLELEF